MSVLAVGTRPTDGATEDHDLVAGVRAGDDRAFELLFARYQPKIAAYVRRFVHDEGRSEDITQEVFIAALRRMREEPGREIQFKPWIYEIAKNKCIDSFRRTRHTSEISFDARDAIRAEEQGRLSELGATPDSQVEDKVAMDNLRGAFGGLSRLHHEILVMREFEGLSYREIGDRLGMSRAAVESTLFRARKRLSVEYDELVSGERCLRVQRLVDEYGVRPAGLRDRNRMARHLAHCQPCRRHACRAGVDLGAVVRPPAAAAAKIAAFLPLPAFLRRRWGADDATAPWLGHGGSVGQWSANAATVVDPGVVSHWTKAVATAATVAVAGMGAGAAITERTPFGAFGGGADKPRSAPALSGAGPQAPAARRQAREDAAPRGAQGAAKPAGPAASQSSERAGAAAIVADPAGPTAAPHSHSQPGRQFDSNDSAPPAAAGTPDRRGDAGAQQPAPSLGKIIGSVGAERDPGTTAADTTGAAGSGTPGLLDGLAPAGAASGDAPGGAVDQVSGAASGLSGTASSAADSVTSTASDTVATTTVVAHSLGR